MNQSHKMLEKCKIDLAMNQKNNVENEGGNPMEKDLLRKIAEILLQEHLLTVEEQIAFNKMLQET